MYAPTGPEYEVTLCELRQYKMELPRRVEDNEPDQWVQLKFTKERWGKLNNPIVSWEHLNVWPKVNVYSEPN